MHLPMHVFSFLRVFLEGGVAPAKLLEFLRSDKLPPNFLLVDLLCGRLIEALETCQSEKDLVVIRAGFRRLVEIAAKAPDYRAGVATEFLYELSVSPDRRDRDLARCLISGNLADDGDALPLESYLTPVSEERASLYLE